MTGGAGIPNVVLAAVVLPGKPYRQTIGIKKCRLLRQVTEFVDIGGRAKQLRRICLLKYQEKIVGQKARALGGGVKPQAGRFVPTLIKVDGGGITFTKRATFNGNRTSVRIVIPHLIKFADS